MFSDKHSASKFCPTSKTSHRRMQQRQLREEELLELAEQIMEIDGFSGFTMDKLVSACGYSKGTVYNHFNSKEDLLCALCIKAMQTTLGLFHKALSFEGNSREKILAIHFAYQLQALRNPTQFMCVLSSQTPAIKEKADQQRLEHQQTLDNEMTHFCDKLFEQAVIDGEVVSNISIADVTFASWAMSFGSIALMTQAAGTAPVDRTDTDTGLLKNVNILMDGMGWLPLSRDWDYNSTWHRIGEQVFAEELQQLA